MSSPARRAGSWSGSSPKSALPERFGRPVRLGKHRSRNQEGCLGHDKHTVTVLAPAPFLTVTVEEGAAGDEIHFHPGGQGFWVARMLKHLGERPLLCGPLGGESGQVFRGLLSQWGMDMSPIKINASTPVTISDRRSGEREQLAASVGATLARHEVDDLYGRFLDHAMTSGVCVVTGQIDEVLPADVYRRLGHDLQSAEVEVVADLHGKELSQLLEGGPLAILKVSDEDLTNDGLLSGVDAEAAECLEAIEKLIEMGAGAVVLSRQTRAALASIGGIAYRALTPELEPADFRGAGDSMTAGLASALRRQFDPVDMLRLACAAGAANVTRHGLGSADEGLIPNLAERVKVEKLQQGR